MELFHLSYNCLVRVSLYDHNNVNYLVLFMGANLLFVNTYSSPI